MSDVKDDGPKGVLRAGWSGAVGDYAIAGAWAFGGESLVVVDAAGGVYAFDGKSGASVWSHEHAHDGGALAAAMDPSGKRFATAGQDGRVLVWSVAEGKTQHELDVGRAWAENVAWSPDGQWLAASSGRQVRVFGADGVEAWRSEAHPSTVSAIAWASADELATACYGRVAFFGASTGELRQKLEWKGSLVSIALSADGDVVACGSQDCTVHFWRRSTEQDSEMAGYPSKPSVLAFDATGTLLATSGGEAVTVWSFQGNGPEGTRPGVLDFHIEAVTTLDFAPRDLRLASGARDGCVVVWAMERDGKGRSEGAAQVGDTVSGLCWRPDGRALAALDAHGGVTVWRVRDRGTTVRR